MNFEIRLPETRKNIEERELKMTRTLCFISLCYILFVGPIYFCVLFRVTGVPYIFCYILYEFQVSLL